MKIYPLKGNYVNLFELESELDRVFGAKIWRKHLSYLTECPRDSFRRLGTAKKGFKWTIDPTYGILDSEYLLQELANRDIIPEGPLFVTWS